MEKLYWAKDEEGLLDYLGTAPLELTGSGCFSPFPLGHWATWAHGVAIGTKVQKTWHAYAASDNPEGFIQWLDENAHTLSKIETWFVLREAVCAGHTSLALPSPLVIRLMNTLSPEDRLAVVNEPAFWSVDATGDPIVRAAWQSLEGTERRNALPSMIKKAAIGNRLDMLDEWDGVCDQMRLATKDRNYTDAVYSAALSSAYAAVRKIIAAHHPDMRSLLNRWSTEGEDGLVDEFLVEGFSGATLINIHQEIASLHPDTLLPRSAAKILALSRQAHAGDLPVPDRSRPRHRA